MSFNYFDSTFLSFDLTYLPRHVGMELAPCIAFGETGCQGFIGPHPSAFLDK